MNKIKFQIPACRQARSDAGFSLIELLVVLAIVTTLLSIGVSALVTYSNAQVFNSKVSEMATTLETAKTYAQSQVKKCGDAFIFVGYRVSIESATLYKLSAICKNSAVSPVYNYTDVETKTLRTPFTVSPITTVTFDALTGVSSGGSITITGYGRCQSVTVTAAGNIKVGNVLFACS